MDSILFLVTSENEHTHVITYSLNREDAKRAARMWLGNNPDKYTVTPLTNKGDQVIINTVLFV